MSNYGTFKYKGMPIFPSDIPCFGNVYFVDGTNGLDGNTGLTPDKAFLTIQRALTVQIADATGRGDRIYVLPGTYAESITGDMTDVSIIGAGATPNSVLITPTDGGSYAGAMTNSAIRNLTMFSSSSANPEYAACRVSLMTGSIIDGCWLYAGTDTSTDATGFRLGYDEVGGLDGSDKVIMYRSSFTNNVIGSAISGDCFYWGFVFGASVDSVGTNASSHYSIGSTIGYNKINAETHAIYLNHNRNAGGSTYIIGNQCMGAHLSRGECATGAITAYADGEDNVLLKVIENYCSAAHDVIKGFNVQNIMGNYVGLGHNANPTRELPAGA